MSTSVSITLHLTVHDSKEFRQAAHDRALTDGLDAETAQTFLNAEATSLGECAVMLFDPGMSPPGCSIEDSSHEEEPDLSTEDEDADDEA